MMDGEAGEIELIDGGGSSFFGNRFIGIFEPLAEPAEKCRQFQHE